VHERNLRNGQRREVERRPFSACEPKASRPVELAMPVVGRYLNP
jgi:hypothetical protein